MLIVCKQIVYRLKNIEESIVCKLIYSPILGIVCRFKSFC